MTIKVGFIGLGNMGRRMAQRLLAEGHELVVFDRDPASADALGSLGAHRAETPAQIGAIASRVFLSLPNGEAVSEVSLGAEGLMQGNKVVEVIDFSTVGPAISCDVACALQARGIDFIDAPVSGGTAGARDGTLTIMAACPVAVINRLRPALSLFGRVHHVGERPGQAQVMKLANNLLAVGAIALASEAMVMGTKAGLDPTQMLEIINAGSGRNSATADKFPKAVLTGTFDFGFSTGLSHKDVSLCVDEANEMGIPMIVGAALRQLLAITTAVEGPQSDFTSVCRVLETWAGVQVRSRGSSGC